MATTAREWPLLRVFVDFNRQYVGSGPSSCVQGMFGGMYYPCNGHIEVPPEDVTPLLRLGYTRLDAQ